MNRSSRFGQAFPGEILCSRYVKRHFAFPGFIEEITSCSELYHDSSKSLGERRGVRGFPGNVFCIVNYDFPPMSSLKNRRRFIFDFLVGTIRRALSTPSKNVLISAT